ncbi:hypothetical protein B0H14DRAFT_2584128 [Mycena olivaceomarginata]|nr:hypothetical protein B0H14DRAFT_2584128 [Mycena olivaceomarginata]
MECSRTEGVPVVGCLGAQWGMTQRQVGWSVGGSGVNVPCPSATPVQAQQWRCALRSAAMASRSRDEICERGERVHVQRRRKCWWVRAASKPRKRVNGQGERKRGRKQSANECEGGCGDWARTVRASVPCVEEYVNTGIDEARRVGAAVAWGEGQTSGLGEARSSGVLCGSTNVIRVYCAAGAQAECAHKRTVYTKVLWARVKASTMAEGKGQGALREMCWWSA